MNILLAAFSCSPEQGSEPGVGWKTAQLLDRQHHLFVLTHPHQQNSIEKAQATGQISQTTRFIYLGRPFEWHPNRMLARLQSWYEYIKWLMLASRMGSSICRENQIELVHHLTFTTWRLPPMRRPSEVPLIWGPLGGTAQYPWRLLGGCMSISSACFEIFRNLLNFALIRNPFLQKGARRASCILTVNKESKKWMQRMVGPEMPMHLVSAAFFSKSQVETFLQICRERPPDAPLRAFAGGNLIGSKGVGLALRALRIAKDQGVVIPYTVASHGPEKSYLEKLAAKLGIREQVAFHPGYRGAQYQTALRDHSICLLPSFREGSAITLLEAMLAGQVPVVVDASTPGEIVSSQCGFAVKGNSAEEIVRGLAQGLIALAEHPQKRVIFSKAAHEKVARENLEAAFLNKLTEAYATALKGGLIKKSY